MDCVRWLVRQTTRTIGMMIADAKPAGTAAHNQLILWDDQGFGDTLQNLGWILEAASRVVSLRILCGGN